VAAASTAAVAVAVAIGNTSLLEDKIAHIEPGVGDSFYL
jgi:hypothetical protein